MSTGLSLALALAAQAGAVTSPTYGPVPESPAPTQAGPQVKVPARECATPAVPDPNSREIVVCAVKPNGYRLDPDVLAARRMKKKGESVAPRNPHETFVEHNCATIGPMGCRGQVMIDAFTAAAVLATMADRVSKGQEIGSMFETEPTSSDYQLYLEAKRQREAAEAEKAAKAKAAAARAEADKAQAQH